MFGCWVGEDVVGVCDGDLNVFVWELDFDVGVFFVFDDGLE